MSMSASVRVYAAPDRHVRTRWEASSVLDLAVSAILSMLSSSNVEVRLILRSIDAITFLLYSILIKDLIIILLLLLFEI